MLEHTSGRAPVRLAVVGHTNTGKTSLLRTLMRDGRFGEVSSRPSTTRHVEGARLSADGQVRVELYDTPGMEDPIGLGDAIEALIGEAGCAAAGLDGPARIERFLASTYAQDRFEQEAKVLRQLRASDAGLYVVDARDPVLPKHREELTLLGQCARPLLPVLNFVRDARANEPAWREALARLGLHAVVRFDSVAPEHDAERLLYGKLATLLDAARPQLEALVSSRAREAAARHAAGLMLIAELLIDVAACRTQVSNDEAALTEAVEALNAWVRQRERQCTEALLQLYQFSRDDLDALDLPWVGGRWEEDLFNPEALRTMGIKLGGGVAAGAAAGLGMDIALAGLSLGMGTALGALAGGGWQALRHYGERVRGRLLGQRTLTVDDAIVRLVAIRQGALSRALEARGHAAVERLRQRNEAAGPWQDGPLPAVIERARAHPEWSTLNGPIESSPERESAVQECCAALEAGAASKDPPG